MANKRQRKKAARKAAEKQLLSQVAQDSRLSASRKYITNEHGVKVRKKELARFNDLMSAAYDKRQEMLQAEARLPRKHFGRDTGDTVGSMQQLGYESDFIIRSRSKSLAEFKTKASFDNYLKNLERVNDPEYLAKRVSQYKANYIAALRSVFGKPSFGIQMKVKRMNDADFMKMVQAEDEALDIQYAYRPMELTAKFNNIRSAFGLPEYQGTLEEPYL